MSHVNTINPNHENSETFEDASDLLSKTNEQLVDEIIENKNFLNLNDCQGESKSINDLNKSNDESDDDAHESDNFVDCIAMDENSQRDYESTLSDEELNENKTKANEFKTIGNEFYKNGDYLKSTESYSSGISICPLKYNAERAILFGNRAAAHIQLKNNEMAIQDCNQAIELDPIYTKVILRRAKLYEETNKFDESLEDFKRVLESDMRCVEAKKAIDRLPAKITERNEKMKEEMLGKLKDLGNMILKPFGLSTNNFQMQQDPNTGSYSMNFNQNSKP